MTHKSTATPLKLSLISEATWHASVFLYHDEWEGKYKVDNIYDDLFRHEYESIPCAFRIEPGYSKPPSRHFFR